MQETTAQFERHWQDFITRLRGRILRQQPPPAYPQMDLLLSSYRLEWAASDTACGRWLAALRKQNREKADQIEAILTQDMRFSPLPPAAAPSPVTDFALSAAAAAATAGVCILTGCSLAVKIGAALGAAGLTFGGTQYIRKQKTNQKQQSDLAAYLDQLSKYKDQVIHLLADA